jgi:hypothetical protein
MYSKRLRSAHARCWSADRSYGACALAAKKARSMFWKFSDVSWMKRCCCAVARSSATSDEGCYNRRGPNGEGRWRKNTFNGQRRTSNCSILNIEGEVERFNAQVEYKSIASRTTATSHATRLRARSFPFGFHRTPAIVGSGSVERSSLYKRRCFLFASAGLTVSVSRIGFVPLM